MMAFNGVLKLCLNSEYSSGVFFSFEAFGPVYNWNASSYWLIKRVQPNLTCSISSSALKFTWFIVFSTISR